MTVQKCTEIFIYLYDFTEDGQNVKRPKRLNNSYMDKF